MWMQIFVAALGRYRVYPVEKSHKQLERAEARKEAIPEHIKSWNAWVHKRDGGEDAEAHRKRMNPHGYFESKFCVPGIRWSMQHAKEIEDLMGASATMVMKVVGSGLVNTPPDYVGRIVFSLRNPRDTATSQEDLTGRVRIRNEGDGSTDLRAMQRDHSPMFWIKSIVGIARWLRKHPHIPSIVVDYDDLLSDPDTHLQRVQDFMGEGDFVGAGKTAIKPGLKRSKARENPPEEARALFDLADEIYASARVGDWESVHRLGGRRLREASEPVNSKDARDRPFYCYRKGKATVRAQCIECYKATSDNVIRDCDNVMRAFRMAADRREHDWKSQPCKWECAVKPEGPHITPEESIENNFWDRPKDQPLET
jgi:hypothetical protein